MKTKLQPSQKLNLKPILMYAFAGIIGAVLVGIGTFFYLSVGSSLPVKAAAGDVIRSINSGEWNEEETWDLTRVPENGDRVIIESGHNVTARSRTFNGEIIVNGVFNLAAYSLFYMNNTSKLAINQGGRITFNFLSTIYLQDDGLIYREESGPIAYGTGAEALLPIDLLAFDVKMNESKRVAITWSTASEENNDFFTLERSLDGRNFFVLDTIAGAGTSNTLREYTYTDEKPAAGTNYYRLKPTDYDGKFEYFKIVSVYNESISTELEMVTIGPNPYRDHFKVNFFSGDKDSVHLKLMDMTGKTVFTKSLEAEVGNNSFIYHDEQNLKPGIYIFTIMQKGVSAKTFRIVKNS